MKDKRQSVRMEELFAVMLGMEVVNNHLCSTCVTCYSVEERYEMAALMAKKPVWMSTEILNKENNENTMIAIVVYTLTCCYWIS